MSSRRKFIRNMVGASAGLGMMTWSKDLLANDDFAKLTILHTNDIVEYQYI